jgi:eukaryotic-like serine/threonine-protein kinase
MLPSKRVLPETKREGASIPPSGRARFQPVPGMVVADKYRVDRPLGEGGMGLVVAATHLGLDQHVAIKFLQPEAMRSRVAVERFLREARVAAKVRSEYVARVHDVGTLEGGVPYIVMEHLAGSDLGQLIKAGVIPIDEACEMALQACEALAEVHAAGIVHRDLKPSNLFITRRADGSPAVKLLDFGISKLTAGQDDSTADPGLTATATIMGSPSYMSPEQLKSTKEVDPRTDVWSLGAVLYEAITGKQAFRGESVHQVIAMIASEDPMRPSLLRQGVPPELERAVLRCLDKDPGTRIPLVDLAGALAHFAPERAKPSLERIEATIGVRSSRPLMPSRPPEGEVAGPPIASSRRPRSAPQVGPEPRRARGGSAAFKFLVLAAVGLLGVGLFTGRISVRGVQGGLAGATSAVGSSAASAVSSAANALSSAAGAVSSAVASSISEIPLPSALPPLPFVDPTAPSSEAESNDESAEGEASAPVAARHPGGGPAKSPAPKPHPLKRHTPKPLRHRR